MSASTLAHHDNQAAVSPAADNTGAICQPLPNDIARVNSDSCHLEIAVDPDMRRAVDAPPCNANNGADRLCMGN
jgi:hypothetical protein